MLDGKTGVDAIGRAIVRAAARYGANVAFTFHKSADAAAALVQELAKGNVRCIYAQVAGNDNAAVETFVADPHCRETGCGSLIAPWVAVTPTGP